MTARLASVADYALLGELRQGNHGTYYLARPPARLELDVDTVVVKVVEGELSEQGFRRAVRELRAFARVRSPHLVPVLDAGQHSGRLFYTIPHHPEGDLGRPARPLARPDVLRAVADAARAAHDLHEAGLAHRDIRPENVLLTGDGARLADLGLAQVLQPGVTVTGVGSLSGVEYLDPRVLQGHAATRQTDVYALGVTLHRALTGRGVFGDLPVADPLLAVRAVLSQQPRPADDLDAEDAALVADCLDPDLSVRPSTALAVAARLDALCGAPSR